MVMTRILTGITPSGTPHLGNYVGAIRPALRLSQQTETVSFYFLADLHSLIKRHDPQRTHRSTLEVAASWLACGLDPQRVHFYRQSDIPEITQLMWILSCIAAKGTLNRAHAYKAAVDLNRSNSQEDDAGISMGLYLYPILMAADILLFNPDKIPVGRDQIQHVEIARDLAQRFNHIYNREIFKMPDALVEEQVAILPGLDGRKMSKSYDNQIPLFSTHTALKKSIFSIVTDSRAPGEAKKTQGSTLFDLYQAFASDEQTREMESAYAEGIGWSDVKQKLLTCIESEVAPLRETYNKIIAQPQQIEDQLHEGAKRVRQQHVLATFKLLRSTVGLKNLAISVIKPAKSSQSASKRLTANIKQYRGEDRKFYVKLYSKEGQLLLQSDGFNTPQEAKSFIDQLKGSPNENDIQAWITDKNDYEEIRKSLAELTGQSPTS